MAKRSDLSRRIDSFWRWFQQNDDRLYHFERAQDEIFDDLSNALDRVHESLCFEFGPAENGRREFIVSADGDKHAFPSVQSLVRAAPVFDRWIVIPFRPPKDLADFRRINYGSVTLDVDDIWFSYEPSGEKIDIVLFVRDLGSEHDTDRIAASYIMLDMALGEFVVETRIGAIERQILPSDPASEGLLPIAKLPETVGLQLH